MACCSCAACGASILRVLCFVLQGIMMVLGVAIMGSGIALVTSAGSSSFATIVILVGLFLMLLALFGVCGTKRYNRPITLIYCIVVIILIICEIGIAIMFVAAKPWIMEQLRSVMSGESLEHFDTLESLINGQLDNARITLGITVGEQVLCVIVCLMWRSRIRGDESLASSDDALREQELSQLREMEEGARVDNYKEEFERKARAKAEKLKKKEKKEKKKKNKDSIPL